MNFFLRFVVRCFKHFVSVLNQGTSVSLNDQSPTSAAKPVQHLRQRTCGIFSRLFSYFEGTRSGYFFFPSKVYIIACDYYQSIYDFDFILNSFNHFYVIH